MHIFIAIVDCFTAIVKYPDIAQMPEKNINHPHMIITIPAMDELGYIENCIYSIRKQTYKNFTVLVCVNQPERWWSDPNKKVICENNSKTIAFLKNLEYPPIEILDRSSPGRGFSPHEKGVGHARNLLFEKALTISNENDLIMCLDADTTFKPGYFQSVADIFSKTPDAIAHANPYYHKLTGDKAVDRAILRYEIYMRLYVLNLWRIGSPYAFTPLGSAITMYAKSLKNIGKITPRPAGEDFYLLQKLRKHGRISQYNEHYVYPSPRISKRVPFGTGPAVADGIENRWEKYPVYPPEPFDIIRETYELFPKLLNEDLPIPMDDFFEKIYGTSKIFQQLRLNYKNVDKFTRACHTKIDGLRILQFVRYYHLMNHKSDEDNLRNHLKLFFGKQEISISKYFLTTFKFANISISLLQNLRDLLTDKELHYRKRDFYEPELSF